MHGSIYKKYPERINPEIGHRSVVAWDEGEQERGWAWSFLSRNANVLELDKGVTAQHGVYPHVPELYISQGWILCMCIFSQLETEREESQRAET